MSQIEMTSYSRIKTQKTDSKAVIPRGTIVSKKEIIIIPTQKPPKTAHEQVECSVLLCIISLRIV
jgi:hypothetical protein